MRIALTDLPRVAYSRLPLLAPSGQQVQKCEAALDKERTSSIISYDILYDNKYCKEEDKTLRIYAAQT